MRGSEVGPETTTTSRTDRHGTRTSGASCRTRAAVRQGGSAVMFGLCGCVNLTWPHRDGLDSSGQGQPVSR
jgi:hypothetical protein